MDGSVRTKTGIVIFETPFDSIPTINLSSGWSPVTSSVGEITQSSFKWTLRCTTDHSYGGLTARWTAEAPILG